VEIIAASTIYGLFSAFLLFPHMGLPRQLQWAAMSLLTAELFALGLYAFYSFQVGQAMATRDVPVLGAGLIVLGMMRTGEGARHGITGEGRERDRSGAARRRARGDRVRSWTTGVRAWRRGRVQARGPDRRR
jgi:hypothetical protein